MEITEIVEQMKDVPKFDSIEGPFTDTFTGKEFYIGIIDKQVKVKFNLKYVEMGKSRIIQEI